LTQGGLKAIAMKMLICTIGSKRHKATLRFAQEVAKALSAEVTLLGVVDKKRKVDELGRVLDQVAQGLSEQGLPVQVRVEAGNAEDVVVDELEATTYDLVALGALGKKRSHHSFLSSVALRIIERAQASVLVVKGDRPSLSRVLICASGTEHGHLSVWAGAALACGAGARATVLHVVNTMPTMYTGLEQMEETLTELLRSDTEMARELRWAAQVVKAECELSELKLRRGIAVEEIMSEARGGDYDIIVLGSSAAASGFVRALMGDLAREVVTRAQRPVLVVRPMA
jgi:nucleotide-binding universal stress UspA family protein